MGPCRATPLGGALALDCIGRYLMTNQHEYMADHSRPRMAGRDGLLRLWRQVLTLGLRLVPMTIQGRPERAKHFQVQSQNAKTAACLVGTTCSKCLRTRSTTCPMLLSFPCFAQRVLAGLLRHCYCCLVRCADLFHRICSARVNFQAM